MKLYDYQEDIIAATRKAILKGHKHICVQSPTGSGKTVMFSYIAKGAIDKGGRVLILTDRDELQHATSKTIESFGIRNYKIQAGQKNPPPDYYQCYVAMAQTVKRRLGLANWEKWFDKFSIIIVDECHKQEFNDILTEIRFRNAIVLGFSATPSRMGKMKQLGEYYTIMVKGLQVQELIDRKKLTPAKHFGVIAPSKNKFKLNSKGDDYDTSEMFAAFDKREVYAGAVEAYVTHANDKINLVFCCNIQHVINTCREFNEAGIQAKFLVSAVAKPVLKEGANEAKISKYQKDLERYNNYIEAYKKWSGPRESVLNNWMTGEYKVLINAGILTTGFDFPAIECIQVLRKTISLPLLMQIFGRGSRIFAGKDYFIILDHGQNIQQLGKYNDNREWSLVHKTSENTGVAPIKECGDCTRSDTKKVDGKYPDKQGRFGCGAYIKASQMICPFCGYQYQTDRERVRAELELLDSPIIPAKNVMIKEVFAFEDIERTAVSRGYKEGWTIRQIAMKHGFAGLEQYRKEKKYSSGWSWSTWKRLGLEEKIEQ